MKIQYVMCTHPSHPIRARNAFLLTETNLLVPPFSYYVWYVWSCLVCMVMIHIFDQMILIPGVCKKSMDQCPIITVKEGCEKVSCKSNEYYCFPKVRRFLEDFF